MKNSIRLTENVVISLCNEIPTIPTMNQNDSSQVCQSLRRTMATRSSPEEQPKKKMSKGKSVQEQMMNTGAALLKSDEDEDDEDEN